MIGNRYNQIPHPALKTKRETTKHTNTQPTANHEKQPRQTERTAPSQTGGHPAT